MCGISGSKSRESGFYLYQQNLSRGCYSSSITCIYPNGHFIFKKLGPLNLDDVPLNAGYYLFHSRGPTVETTSFNWDDNHPFCYGRFIVSHNGGYPSLNSEDKNEKLLAQAQAFLTAQRAKYEREKLNQLEKK